MTRITNKHLLPVFDRPMIYYPLECLVQAGFDEIMVVTGGNNAGDFLRLLKNGREFGLRHLDYTYQEGEGGIAEALGLCEHFADGGPVCVMLGDNIFQYGIEDAVERYRMQGSGAMIRLKEVEDPERFGVAELDGDRVVRIVEKPSSPPSALAVTGIYFYDNRVFEIIQTLEPSKRGELEITDVNNRYAEWGELGFDRVEGWWADAGTIESLHRAATLCAASGANRPRAMTANSVEG